MVTTSSNQQIVHDTAYNELKPIFGTAQAETLAVLMVGQSQYESTNYTSNVYIQNNNAFGYKYFKGSAFQLSAGTMSPEKNNYAKYLNLSDSTKEVAHWIIRRKTDFHNVNTPDEYAKALKKNDYYGESSKDYGLGILHYIKDFIQPIINEVKANPNVLTYAIVIGSLIFLYTLKRVFT